MDGEDQSDMSTAVARVVVGLLQGVALYLLFLAFDDKTWPATNNFLLTELLFLALYVPLIVLVGLGNLRLATLAIWAIVAAAAVAAFGWYGIWQEPQQWIPEARVFLFTFAFLFIAHALVAGGDHDRRVVAHYATHFDVAWKLGLQMVLSCVFVGIFWGVLELGATLFGLIGLTGFRTFIDHRWFAIPATTLALATAVHLTDVRAGLVRGTRTLVLVLLSWLLPLMAAIAFAFLLSLAFTGLEPLWKTRFAAGSLLLAAAMLIVLINAAFQDGDAERFSNWILRYATSLASFLLLPLVAIAAYAIYLRVAQYGWTADRVNSAACATVGAFYAVGYAIAALPFGPWLARLSLWNFLAALLVLAVIAATFSPVADPDRIAVDSQVARLGAGKTKPEAFDYSYLRWRSGRFGVEALQKLERFSGPNADSVRTRAKAALANGGREALQRPVPKNFGDNVSVYPKGRTLPDSFLHKDWSRDPMASQLPTCLTNFGEGCDAFFLALTADGREQIVILGADRNGAVTGPDGVFAQDGKGDWHMVGVPEDRWLCSSVRTALRRGELRIVPADPVERDVEVRGLRLKVNPSETPCPP